MSEETSQVTQECLDKIAEALPDGITDAELIAMTLSILKFYGVEQKHGGVMLRIASEAYEIMEEQEQDDGDS